MGSRKKKIRKERENSSIVQFYKALSLNDKIAFKSFFYCYGEANLSDLFRHSYFGNIGFFALKNAVEDGYSWL